MSVEDPEAGSDIQENQQGMNHSGKSWTVRASHDRRGHRPRIFH
ncbi:hypothetical protein [Novipirellula sp.]